MWVTTLLTVACVPTTAETGAPPIETESVPHPDSAEDSPAPDSDTGANPDTDTDTPDSHDTPDTADSETEETGGSTFEAANWAVVDLATDPRPDGAVVGGYGDAWLGSDYCTLSDPGGARLAAYGLDAGMSYAYQAAITEVPTLGGLWSDEGYGYVRGDRAGDSILEVACGDINGDGLGDVSLPRGWDPDHTDGSYLTSLLAVKLGPVEGEYHFADAELHILLAEVEQGAIWNELADIDGDGLDDILLLSSDSPTIREGFGSDDGWLAYTTVKSGDVAVEDADFMIQNSSVPFGEGEFFLAGDVNGDGSLDIGARGDDFMGEGPRHAGYVDILYGPFTGPCTIDDAEVSIDGGSSGRWSYFATASNGAYPGDLDGDGSDDLIVTAWDAAALEEGNFAGAALGYVGLTGGTTDGDDAWLELGPEFDLGAWVTPGATIADFNGNGIADVALSRPSSDTGVDGGGDVLIFTDATSGTRLSPDLAIAGMASGTGFPGLLATLDIDGDGKDDLLASADDFDLPPNYDAGAVFTWLGSSLFP